MVASPPGGELSDFAWSVTDTGYRAVETITLGDKLDTPGGWYLTDGVPLFEVAVQRRHYAPLREATGLFQTFARMTPSDERIVTFANDYGLLGKPFSREIWAESKKEACIGERISDWHRQIGRMRAVLRLWEISKGQKINGPDQDLRKNFVSISRMDYEELVYISHPEFGPRPKWNATNLPFDYLRTRLCWAGTRPDLDKAFATHDYSVLALAAAQQVINPLLQELKVVARLLFDHGRLVLRLVPPSLIGAMWLQMAQAISGGKDYRQCAACPRWFEVSPITVRRDRIYCSDACKTRAFRARQADNAASKSKKRKRSK